jgi:hypothetical protein
VIHRFDQIADAHNPTFSQVVKVMDANVLAASRFQRPTQSVSDHLVRQMATTTDGREQICGEGRFVHMPS